MNAVILVAFGGAMGALARYGVSIAVTQVWRDPFPLGTLLINIAGSLAMGLLAGWLAKATPPGQEELRLLIGVGILGGFTTFSAFSLDVMTMIQRNDLGAAAFYVLGSMVLSVFALFVGLVLIRSLPA
jgi:CrcB protein